MKLNKATIRNMLPGQTLYIKCDDAAELDSTTQVAHRARREMGDDGAGLEISRSAKTMTVVVTKKQASGG